MFRVRILLVAVVFGALLLTATPAFAAPATTAAGSGCAQFYTVMRGDNLFRIALRFSTTLYTLQQLNGLANPSFIYAGQVLCVKAGAPIPFGFLYVVKRGDTLYSIAARFGWGVRYLAGVNHLHNPNILFAGMVLLIPYHP
jgi:spore germination protein